MSMVKVITPDAYQFDEPAAQFVKMSRRGVFGADLAILEKRASSRLLHNIDKIREKVAADEMLVHLLAFGSTEGYGPNRNGDGFREDVCRRYHHTFVKHARWYRNHANKDPSKSYGHVVASDYNDAMRRVELLVALNAEKSAALRNGGLVADREIEKIAAGKMPAVSMACKVPFDICSYCGNQAPGTKDYCTGTYQGGRCKAGGLRDNMGMIVEIDNTIHHLHADNTEPRFFDISDVPRGADRIAFVTGQLTKSAGMHNRIIKSADLARQMGISVPYELVIDNSCSPHVQRMVKLAYDLASIEQSFEAGERTYLLPNGLAFTAAAQNADADLVLPAGVRDKFAHWLYALGEAGICLPVNRFIEVVAGQSREKAAEIAVFVSRELPSIYSRLTDDPQFHEKVAQSQYAPASSAAPIYKTWAAKHASDLSLFPRYVHSRVLRAALHQESAPVVRGYEGGEKIAAAADPVTRLAEEYALYKLSFVGSVPMDNPDFPLTASLAVLQNYA